MEAHLRRNLLFMVAGGVLAALMTLALVSSTVISAAA